jgi:hypothetical protein
VVYLVVKKGKTPLLTANDTVRFRLDEKISTGKKMSGGEVRIGMVSKLPELMQQGVLRVGSGRQRSGSLFPVNLPMVNRDTRFRAARRGLEITRNSWHREIT